MSCQVWDLHLFLSKLSYRVLFRYVGSLHQSYPLLSTIISYLCALDLFIIFNSDSVVNSFSCVSTPFSEQSSSMSVIFLRNLDIFRVNIYHKIIPRTEYKIIVKFDMLYFSFYNNFMQNALRCFLSEF